MADQYTKLLLNFDEGRISPPTFTDSSASQHTILTVNNVISSTAQKKFGTSSFRADFTYPNYLSIPDSVDWDFLDVPWTIDFWFNFFDTDKDAVNNGIIGQNDDAGNGWSISYKPASGLGNRSIEFRVEEAYVSKIYWYIEDARMGGGFWTHMAFVWDGADFYFFSDGRNDVLPIVLVDNVLPTSTISAPLTIGRAYRSQLFFDGYLDELRLSKGIARWTSNFTVPSSPYTTDSYTKLLLHFEETTTVPTFIDKSSSPKTITTHNDVINNFDYPAAYIRYYYDNYLSIDVGTSDFNIFNGDWTISFWALFGLYKNHTLDEWCSKHCILHQVTANEYMSLTIDTVTGDVLLRYIQSSAEIIKIYAVIPDMENESLVRDNWYHFAFVRNANTSSIYFNGASLSLDVSSTYTAPVTPLDGSWVIGSSSGEGEVGLEGAITDLRIDSIARWTTDFDPDAGITDIGGTIPMQYRYTFKGDRPLDYTITIGEIFPPYNTVIKLLNFSFECDQNLSISPLEVSIISDTPGKVKVVKFYTMSSMSEITSISYQNNKPSLVSPGDRINIKWNNEYSVKYSGSIAFTYPVQS